jgi:uncharacterized membrane protein YphA (DoxX/SURF4 family)
MKEKWMRMERRMVRISIGFALLVLFLTPASVLAHARWFVEGEHPPTDWSALLSLPVLLAAGAAAGTVVLLALIQRMIGDPLWPRPPFFQRMEPAAPAILGVQAAITLIFEATRLRLFSPNIELPENRLGYLMVIAVTIAAFSFITGVLTRFGALAIIVLWIMAFGLVPWEEVMEQVLYVGIAIYLFAVGRGVVRYRDHREEGESPLSDRLLPYALPILRITVGLSVLTLAFTEKLLNVGLGTAFLDEYPRFNVARELGFTWFTDERFVYLIGIIEATAGAALIAGFMPRLTILLLWVPFNLGIPFLPPQELIGHLPILASMYVLLVRGTEGVPPPEVAMEPAPAQRLADEAAPAQPNPAL